MLEQRRGHREFGTLKPLGAKNWGWGLQSLFGLKTGDPKAYWSWEFRDPKPCLGWKFGVGIPKSARARNWAWGTQVLPVLEIVDPKSCKGWELGTPKAVSTGNWGHQTLLGVEWGSQRLLEMVTGDAKASQRRKLGTSKPDGAGNLRESPRPVEAGNW